MKDNLSLIIEDRHGNHVKLNCFFIASDFLPSWQEVKGNHIWESLANLARLFRWECVPSWDASTLAWINNSRQLVGDFLTAHGKVRPSWPNFYRHQSGATSGQVVLKLRIREGGQLLLKLNRSEWWSSWSPFYGGREPTSGHHDQKLLVTMMVTSYMDMELPPKLGGSE